MPLDGKKLSREEEIELAWQLHRSMMRTPDNRLWLSVALRNRMAEAQNWRCCYCGCRMDGKYNADDAPSFEHILPEWLGGTHEDDNLAISCCKCNNLRGIEMRQEHLDALGVLTIERLLRG